LAQAPAVSIDQLKEIARRVRKHILEMTSAANSGHPGGSLSAVEIVTGAYFAVMHHDPKNPLWPDRDRWIMSKGHATPVIYGVLAEAGYFPADELMTFRKLGSNLQGHVVMQKPAGVEMSGGALGMGLSFSLGQALAGRLDKRDYNVFCLLSDGRLLRLPALPRQRRPLRRPRRLGAPRRPHRQHHEPGAPRR
jgi:transketolase